MRVLHRIVISHDIRKVERSVCGRYGVCVCVCVCMKWVSRLRCVIVLLIIVDLVECSSCQVEGYSLTSCPSLTVPALSGSFRFSH